MRYLKIFFVIMFSILVISGCSKKKEEAAKLEQELLALSQDSARNAAIADSIAADSQLSAEEMAAEQEDLVPAMPKRPAGDGFAVQVASCESEDYARHLISLYTDRGYEPYVTEISIDGQVFYRVRIGLYESVGEANRLKKEIEDKYSISVWIDMVSM